MAWQRIEVIIGGAQAEAFCDVLAEMGAISTEVSDADEGTVRERAVFGEPGASEVAWTHARVVALFEAGADADGAMRNALDRFDLTPLASPRIDTLEDADWVALTQRQVAPIRVGDRHLIYPATIGEALGCGVLQPQRGRPRQRRG